MTLRLRRPLTLVVPVVTSLALAGGALATTGETDGPVLEAPLHTTEKTTIAAGIIVKSADGSEVTPSELAAEVSAELPGGVSVDAVQAGPDGLGVVILSGETDEDALDEALERLEDLPGVEWAVPNGVRFPSASASEPLFGNGSLWNLNGPWGVEADKAWDTTTGSTNVRVAVLDTGRVTGHPDFGGAFVAGRDFIGRDLSECYDARCRRGSGPGTFRGAGDGDGWDRYPTDVGDWRNSRTCAHMGVRDSKFSSWHGTHVAGIVAARRNGSGAVGVAPRAKVQPIRVLGRCGGTDWDIAMGILWASGIDVNGYEKRYGKIPKNRTPSKVINLSLGAFDSLGRVRTACKFYGSIASKARSRGAILIAAAGNEGVDQRYNVPSSCPGYVSVAATTRSGAAASYSNYGSGIDLAAPGGQAGRGVPAEEGVLSTLFTGFYTNPGSPALAWMAGTSMAAPAVSGVAALAHSVGIRNPDVIERVMKATARRSPNCSAARCGAGIVSAYGVVNAKAPTSAPRISGSARPGGVIRATTGSWRNGADVLLTWRRGSTVLARGTTYRPTKSDLGRRLVVRATATNGHPSIFDQSTVVVKSKPKMAFSMPSKFSKSKKVKLRVKIKAPYVRATGTIRVYDGNKRIAVKKIYSKNKGKVTITLPKIKKKGKHRIRVIYSGSTKVSATKKSKVVRVR
ncbi:S8 family serine peptidase [Aeromicrobium sp. JJY06]|uniref:S8 family serine peptidase n=1 Tax=Aeromicrobium sp. JJY06 TaxID=3373478 RepID=UPI00376F291F